MGKGVWVQLRRKLWGKTICLCAPIQSPSGEKKMYNVVYQTSLHYTGPTGFPTQQNTFCNENIFSDVTISYTTILHNIYGTLCILKWAFSTGRTFQSPMHSFEATKEWCLLSTGINVRAILFPCWTFQKWEKQGQKG